MMAALFFLHVATCRSRQLYERLISPPTNHFAQGQFHSRTLSHFLNQCSSPATADQNLSGSSIDSLYRRSYSSRFLTCAFRLNSGDGSNLRCSCRMESMLTCGSMTALSAMSRPQRGGFINFPACKKQAQNSRSLFYTRAVGCDWDHNRELFQQIIGIRRQNPAGGWTTHCLTSLCAWLRKRLPHPSRFSKGGTSDDSIKGFADLTPFLLTCDEEWCHGKA